MKNSGDRFIKTQSRLTGGSKGRGLASESRAKKKYVFNFEDCPFI